MSQLVPGSSGSNLVLPTDTDPQTRVVLVLAVELPLASITVPVVLLRLYCQAFLRDRLFADDFIMGIAMLVSFSMTVTNCLSLLSGTGYHVIDFFAAWVRPTGEYATIAQALFGVTVSLTKISILLFYCRKFPSKLVRLFSKMATIFTVVWGIGDVLGSIFECSPITKFWNPSKDATSICEKYVDFLFITAGLNALGDLVTLGLALSSLWTLRFSKKQIVALIFIFALGILAFGFGLVRILFIDVYSKTNDRPYELAILYVIQASEANLAIISGSLPALIPILDHFSSRNVNAKSKHRRGKRSVEYDSSGRRRYHVSMTGDLGWVSSKTRSVVAGKPVSGGKPIHQAKFVGKERPKQKMKSVQAGGLTSTQEEKSTSHERKDIDEPEQEQLDSSKSPQMPHLNAIATEKRPTTILKKSSSMSSMNFTMHPGAPPNFPLPPIPPKNIMSVKGMPRARQLQPAESNLQRPKQPPSESQIQSNRTPQAERRLVPPPKSALRP